MDARLMFIAVMLNGNVIVRKEDKKEKEKKEI
jgi:hypothetical protein